MRITSLLSLLLKFVFTLQSLQSSEVLDPTKRPLLAFLVGPTLLPACLIKCTYDLKDSLMDFVYGDVTLDSREEICNVFEASTSCIETSTECASYKTLYSKVTSGLRWACDNSGYNPFDSLFPCIVTMGKEARNKSNCAASCNIPNRSKHLFIETSHDEVSKNAFSSFEPFCGPLACYLNCTRKQMNSYCPTSGSKLIHVPASALDELVDEFQRTTSEEKKDIIAQIPESCRIFLKEKEVTAFRFDEVFVQDLFFMITSRKQRTKNGARAQARRIVEELISKMDEAAIPKPPLRWDAKNISIATAMGAVIFINLIGLAFTVYWCLYNDDNNGIRNNNDSSLGANHFVEPNIRMKLKLPRMSAVIKDSSQEVLELRVPRNGNQMNLDEEQQTVVVPRWKRRRTFSVPLDTRPRTNSTGSDQFPNIVILRTHET